MTKEGCQVHGFPTWWIKTWYYISECKGQCKMSSHFVSGKHKEEYTACRCKLNLISGCGRRTERYYQITLRQDINDDLTLPNIVPLTLKYPPTLKKGKAGSTMTRFLMTFWGLSKIYLHIFINKASPDTSIRVKPSLPECQVILRTLSSCCLFLEGLFTSKWKTHMFLLPVVPTLYLDSFGQYHSFWK